MLNTLPLPTDAPSYRPTWRDDLAVAGVAIAMRMIVFGVVTLALGVPLSNYVVRGDGESFVLVSEAMLGRIDYTSIDEYHHRIFLGYPALMALVGTLGVPVGVAGLTITIASAGAAAALAGRVFDDRRIGWATTMLVPHWVINSSLVMTEAPALCLSLLGVWCARRERWIAAGVALAAAGLVRPMACFAVLAVVMALLAGSRYRNAVVVMVACAAVFAMGTIAGAMWRGGVLESARIYVESPRAYGGPIFVPPFTSLLRETTRGQFASVGFSIYIWLHVVFVGASIVMLGRQWRRSRAAFDLLAFVWAIGNTAFVLSIGSIWGYLHFPRFHILSQPTLLSAWTRWLPTRTWVWVLLASGMTVFAIFGVRATP